MLTDSKTKCEHGNYIKRYSFYLVINLKLLKKKKGKRETEKHSKKPEFLQFVCNN